MKHIKEFNSFKLNEGVFDKVKGFKGDKEEEPAGQPKRIRNIYQVFQPHTL